VSVVSQFAANSQMSGSLSCSTAGLVDHQKTKLCIQVSAGGGVVKRLEVRACS